MNYMQWDGDGSSEALLAQVNVIDEEIVPDSRTNIPCAIEAHVQVELDAQSSNTLEQRCYEMCTTSDIYFGMFGAGFNAECVGAKLLISSSPTPQRDQDEPSRALHELTTGGEGGIDFTSITCS